MSITLVQDIAATSGAAATSVTVTLAAPATAGNLLWVGAGMDKQTVVPTGPAGFTAVFAQGSTSLGTYAGWKVASGGETALTVTFPSSAGSNGDTAWVGEFADSDAGSWQVITSATHPCDESTATSWTSGTAADPGRTCAAIAFFGIDSGSNATGSQSWSASFVDINAWANSTKGDIAVGWLASAAGGSTKTTTHTHTPTADQMSGAIATFGRTGTSSAPVTPVSGQFDVGRLEIEFTTGIWTDVSDRYRAPVTIHYGRATQFDQIGAGILAVRLDDPDGAVMPDNQGSPFFPNVVKGKRIRWTVGKQGQEWCRFVGWIQAWEPRFPQGSIAKAYTDVTAVDALGLMALRRMRSNWTERALSMGRLASINVDAIEATGSTNGWFAQMTNYSQDSGVNVSGLYAYNGNWPNVTFSSDRDVSVGQVVVSSPDSDGDSNSTIPIVQANHQTVMWLLKTPTEQPAVGNPWFCTTVHASGLVQIMHIVCEDNGASNFRIAAYNAAGAASLGTIRNPITHGQWCVIQLRQNSGTATHLDVLLTDLGTMTTSTLSNINVDVRSVRELQFPTGTGKVSAASFGGVIALGQKTGPSAIDASPTGAQGSLSTRLDGLINACTQLPVSFTKVGTLTTLVVTGTWSDRTALELANEAMLTGLGICFARPRDSQVLFMGADQCYPVNPSISIDIEGEMLGDLRLSAAVDNAPTRVQVDYPGGQTVRYDAVAEANGENRQTSVSTIAPVNAASFGSTVADAVGDFLLAHRTSEMRITQVPLDLAGPVRDWTAELFDASTTLGGLYPTMRIRLANLPASHFGASTRDLYVEGWTEVYADDSASITFDTSPAPDATPRPQTVRAPALGAAQVGGFNRVRTPPPRPLILSSTREQP